MTIYGILIGFGFIDRTRYYNAIANLHTLQITAADIESSPACSVFNSHYLVTDINSGDFSDLRPQVRPLRRTSNN
jgi:hypothetical protein